MRKVLHKDNFEIYATPFMLRKVKLYEENKLYKVVNATVSAEYLYDPADTTSPDDADTIIVNAAGQRLTKIGGGGGGSDGNNYPTALDLDGNILTLERSGLSDLTVDLSPIVPDAGDDGRFTREIYDTFPASWVILSWTYVHVVILRSDIDVAAFKIGTTSGGTEIWTGALTADISSHATDTVLKLGRWVPNFQTWYFDNAGSAEVQVYMLTDKFTPPVMP